MHLLRSERFPAVLLVGAAVLGLVAANSPAGPTFRAIAGFGVGPLTIDHVIKDGLLAVFFFLAAIELRHELQHGELDSPSKALVPTIAAIGGVIVPAGIYLAVAGGGVLGGGWPIPTATDIAFALGVLGIAGRGLPARFRALLLAIAVIDDLIAILIIAVFFTRSLSIVPLLIAVPAVLLFGWLSRRASDSSSGRVVIAIALVVLGIAAWALVWLSGIHPTIAGVALGLSMAPARAEPTRYALNPWSNAVILPLFAFVAALVAIPSMSPSDLSPAFWAILIALPIGKLVGIAAGASIASAVSRANSIPIGDLIAVAALGGIGFTVSLLMNELAFGDRPEIADEITIAVLLASVLAAILGGALTAIRARHYAQISS